MRKSFVENEYVLRLVGGLALGFSLPLLGAAYYFEHELLSAFFLGLFYGCLATAIGVLSIAQLRPEESHVSRPTHLLVHGPEDW